MALTLHPKFTLEMCDADGNPTPTFSPFDFHFLLKSKDDTDISTHIGSYGSQYLGDILSGSDDVYQDGVWYLTIRDLGFSLGSGNPGDLWTESSTPPDTFFGLDPDISTNNNAGAGLLSDGSFHITKNSSLGWAGYNNYNHRAVPYLYLHRTGSFSQTNWFPYSSGEFSEWRNKVPIRPSQCSQHEGTVEGGDLTAIKISLGDLRNSMDLVFKEDGLCFSQINIQYSTWASGHFMDINTVDGTLGGSLSYDTILPYISPQGWGDSNYPAMDFNSGNPEDVTVPYDAITGNDILFGFSVDIARWNEGGSPIVQTSHLGDVTFGDYYHTAGQIHKKVTFNTGEAPPSYADPLFVIGNPSISMDGSPEQGGSVTGTFQFAVGGDFTGDIKVLIVDSSDNLDEFPFEVNGVADVCDLGVVDFNNENTPWGTLISGVVGGTGIYESEVFTYTANETGNLSDSFDFFSVYVILDTFTGEGLPDDQVAQWQEYFQNMVSEGTNVFKIENQGMVYILPYDPPVGGCTDPTALNYNPDADFNDGSCQYFEAVSGCTDPTATNYNELANVDHNGDIITDPGYEPQEGWNYNCEYAPPEVGEYDPGEELITNPADVMYHMAEQELKYDRWVNSEKVVEQRENHDEWKLAFAVNKEINSKKLLQEISQSTKYVPTFNNDTFSYAGIKNTYTGEEGGISTIKARDILKYKVSRTDIEKLYTEVEVQYKYDYGLDSYLESTEKLKTNSEYLQGGYGVTMSSAEYLETYDAEDPLAKTNYYGLDFDKIENNLNHEDTSLLFKSDYIRDPQTARWLAEYLLMWHCNQHNLVDMTLPLKYYNLEAGDLIRFDEMIMGKNLYGEKYVLDEPGDMPIRCGQYILPLFIVTDVTKTLKNVKIKVMQLHHLSSDSLVWEGETYDVIGGDVAEPTGTGDLNGDGILNILDAVLAVNIILSVDYIYNSPLDMNFDGSNNILDIVMLINAILGRLV